jgi:spermidine/putrescine transport system substrate-binding protein
VTGWVKDTHAKKSLSRRTMMQAAMTLPLAAALPGCSDSIGTIAATGEPKEVQLYCWDTYIDRAILDDFTRASGVKVTLAVMSSNAELMDAMKGGNAQGYDVIVPSNNYVERLAKAELLLPLDKSAIPNQENIDTPFVDVGYDPGRVYSMPLTWFALGIAYDKRRVKKSPKSWKPLLESDEYKGRIALPAEGADLFRIYTKYLGKSVNQLDSALITTIEQMIQKQKANLKSFHQDDGQDMLDHGEVDMVMEFNGDIAQLMRKNPNIAFVVPNEGTLLNGDNLCIPVGAKHPKNAHALINFLLAAQIGKRIAETKLYPTCNGAAKAMMGPDYLKNPVLYLPAEPLARSEFAFLNEERDAMIDQAFARIMGGGAS